MPLWAKEVLPELLNSECGYVLASFRRNEPVHELQSDPVVDTIVFVWVHRSGNSKVAYPNLYPSSVWVNSFQNKQKSLDVFLLKHLQRLSETLTLHHPRAT